MHEAALENGTALNGMDAIGECMVAELTEMGLGSAALSQAISVFPEE